MKAKARARGWLLGGALLLGFATGCRTGAARGPAVDLAAPGWTVRHGQAVWTAARGQAGVAGELSVAQGPDGACWVQFAKPPFALATAQADLRGWRLEMPGARVRRHGKGPAPDQWVWFTIAAAVRGQMLTGDWRFAADGTDGWRLVQERTGETLEGYLLPLP